MFTTLGHDRQKEFLAKVLDTQRVSHAYLFSGPAEIGKRTLAVEFAGKLLGIETSVPNDLMHPDLIQVDAQTCGIADARELITTLALGPYAASRKIAVIDHFDQAKREVSNALLKTIEEPSPTTTLILIAENHKAVLPTILSRVQRLHFSVPADGRIGRTIRLSEDPAFASRYAAARQQLLDIQQMTRAERLLSIKSLADHEDAELSESLRWWSEDEQERLLQNPKAYRNMHSLIAAISGIDRNFNTKLVMQKLMLDLIKTT